MLFAYCAIASLFALNSGWTQGSARPITPGVAGGANGQEAGYEDIIETARRYAEIPSKAPDAVTALSSEMLASWPSAPNSSEFCAELPRRATGRSDAQREIGPDPSPD